MKGISLYITEKLKIEKSKIKIYNWYPTNRDELYDVVCYVLDKRGFDADLNDIDVSQIDDMSYLFSESPIAVDDIESYDGSISGTPDISKWNVSNVKSFSNMFSLCPEFNSDISEWNVSNGNDFSEMFDSCIKFNCDLSKWKVKSSANVSNMFNDCTSLKNIPMWWHNMSKNLQHKK